MLAETKKTSVEVEQNLAKAAGFFLQFLLFFPPSLLTLSTETEKSINNTRESYRDSAARGSVLYFLMVAMSLVNPMYQTSLSRFLELFDRGMNEAPPVCHSIRLLIFCSLTTLYLSVRLL